MKAPEFNPPSYPSFPESVPKVQLSRLSLHKLLNDNETEKEQLFTACKTSGFFLLDLEDSEQGRQLKCDGEQMPHVAQEVFELPLDEKQGYALEKSRTVFGYKGIGGSKTAEGAPDTAEFFNISKDSILNGSPFKNPFPVTASQDLFRSFMTTAHATGHMILSILEAKLHLPPSTLPNLHRITAPSGDHVRLTRSPPLSSELAMEKQHATPAHTDFGSVTILLNWLGGLQIWTPETRGDNDRGQWAYVQPLPGHAIINLGDAMVKFTNGILNSGRHRVLPAPGEQGKFVRYSIVYFVRPEDDVHLRVLESPAVPEGDPNDETFTAKEWIIKKARSIGVKLGEDD